MRSIWSIPIAGFLAIGVTFAAAAANPAGTPLGIGGDGVGSTGANHPPSVVRLAQYNDAYRPPSDANTDTYGSREPYRAPPSRQDDAYRPPNDGSGSYGSGSAYNSGPAPYRDQNRYGDDAGSSRAYQGRTAPPSGGYGEPYAPPPADSAARHDRDGGYPEPRGPESYDDNRSYSQNEIIAAGHGFFGSISQGLASVIEHAFKKAGRPNGYILGEDAGGAFVAGLRYGEGRLYTKDAGTHKVYWQGPSVGYDFGGAGSKTMVLVYNLRDPSDVYHRFGGVEGTAYIVGGVSIQFQKHDDVVMAPIRAGIGLRLGANVGYLKYTRRPTWNPF
ncbi:MAG TPA: DUF1134 domain-containing protein [Defluviicoccus sp.]|nr:DUF1134 domain-containing protein [Defluviicoccus sp.]